jgi:hypothetical protein
VERYGYTVADGRFRGVVVELPVGGRGRVVLDSAAGAGAGAATAVVVTMKGETGSSNAAALMVECIPTGPESGYSS